MTTRSEMMSECPICTGPTRRTIETQQFAYLDGARDVLLTAELPVYTCENCGEQFLSDEGEAIQHEAVCRYLGRLSPREIKALRQSKRMTQHALADATGIGIASIKRWEAGKVIQSAALDMTLRALQEGNRQEPRATFLPVFKTPIQQRSIEKAKLFELRQSS